MPLVLRVLLAALVSTYNKGLHETANSIATVVSTRVLTPRQAILLATFFNLIGALAGTAVAKTVGKGLVDTNYVNMTTLLCAMMAAIAWNLLTWWFGLPSSSSHALIGGLCGAALASAHGKWSVLHWAVFDEKKHEWTGLWPKVVAPMMIAPLTGLLVGFFIMGLLMFLLRSIRPTTVNRVFGKPQLRGAAWMIFTQEKNDPKKTREFIFLFLFTPTKKPDAFPPLPSGLLFLHPPKFDTPLGVKWVGAIKMAAETAAGG